MDYKKKYLKYKLKYENLIGGADREVPRESGSFFSSMMSGISNYLTPPPSVQPQEELSADDFQLLESEPIIDQSRFKYGTNEEVIIEQICCGDKITVVPDRVLGCEASYSHKLLGTAASVKNINSTFDAIVKIVNGHERNPNLNLISRNPNVIHHETNYISDHNSIFTNLLEPNTDFNFNLVSFNIEGLCDRKVHPEQLERRLDLFETQISELVTSGFIMPIQELVLQKDASEIGETSNKISNILNKILESKYGKKTIQFSLDGYTSGIFFDTSIWNLENIVEIPRDKSKPNEKKSNFYLFKHRTIPNLNIGIVNIHLKAPTADVILFSNLSEIQRLELQNILKKVNEINPGFAIPVYLCGDYNNGKNKDIQIFNATRIKTKNLQTGEEKINQNMSIFLHKSSIF
jgi:hypothetical protein